MKPKPKTETEYPYFMATLHRAINRAIINPGRRFGVFYNRETRKFYAVHDPERFLKSESLAKTTDLHCTVHHFESQTVINWPTNP